MRLRCPVCHAESEASAFSEDEAARELMARLAQQEPALARALVAYLGLFRARTRALAWSRALRLADEVLALCADRRRLAAALEASVEALLAKRCGAAPVPLANHRYLQRVLEALPAHPAASRAAAVGSPAAAVGDAPRAPGPLSATEEAVLAIRAVRFGPEDAR